MMVQQTIRWQQRFNNYRKALVKLAQAVELLSGQVNREEAVDELMQEGLIQRFEYTHELAWKVMKDYAEYQGYTDVRGSRDAIRKALEMGLVDDRRWMETIEERNLTSHFYENGELTELLDKIIIVYFPLLLSLAEKIQTLIDDTLVCDDFYDKHKLNVDYVNDNKFVCNNDLYDLKTYIDFYDGTFEYKCIDFESTTREFVKEKCKTTYLLCKKGTVWFVFNNDNPSEILFSYECDSIVEFGVLKWGDYFSIVETKYGSKLFIINSEGIYESDYMAEIHSSYHYLKYLDKSYNEKYNVNLLDNDYFIVRLHSEKWQVLRWESWEAYSFGFDFIKSSEYDFIKFIDENSVEIHMYYKGRTLYNTMLTCLDYIKPDASRWKVSDCEERNCSWIAAYDFEKDKEGVILEKYDDYKKCLLEEIIIPFKYDYARVFSSENNTFIALGNYIEEGNVRCAVIDTRKEFLSSFIFEKISTGFSCEDLCFHISDCMADVNLSKDDFIYSVPFLNYETYDNDGRRLIGMPFKNVRLYIDTETTGLPKNNNESYTKLENWPYLVQVALIVEDDNFGILAKRNMILKPDGYIIPESSSKIHRITTEMAIKNGEERERVISFLDRLLYNADMIIGHNVSFDLNVIKAEIIRVKGEEKALFCKKNCEIVDTMILGMDICKIPNLYFYSNKCHKYKYPKLDELYYKLFGEHFNNQHNAMSDIQATFDCYKKMIN